MKKRLISFIAIVTLLTLFSGNAFAARYAYSIGVNHSGRTNLEGDFTANINYANTVYGMISDLNSYYNYTPSSAYLRGNNPLGYRRIGSHVVFFNGHSTSESMLFDTVAQGMVGVDIGYDFIGDSGRYYAGITSTDMHNVQLIQFVGCNTAVGTNNLCTKAMTKGATTALGFTHTINSRNTYGPQWLQKYNDALVNGYTVSGAINYATAVYPGSNLGTYAKLYGNSSLRITSASRSATIAEQCPIVNVSSVAIPNGQNSLLRTSNVDLSSLPLSTLASIDGDFDINDYRITTNFYADDGNTGFIKLDYCIGDIQTTKSFLVIVENGVMTSIQYIPDSININIPYEAALVESVQTFADQPAVFSSNAIAETDYIYDVATGKLTAYVCALETVAIDGQAYVMDSVEEYVLYEPA